MKIKVTKHGEGWARASGPVRQIFSIMECGDIARCVREQGAWKTREMPDRMAEETATAFADAGCEVDYV